MEKKIKKKREKEDSTMFAYQFSNFAHSDRFRFRFSSILDQN
jgi:hypothetical protein